MQKIETLFVFMKLVEKKRTLTSLKRIHHVKINPRYATGYISRYFIIPFRRMLGVIINRPSALIRLAVSIAAKKQKTYLCPLFGARALRQSYDRTLWLAGVLWESIANSSCRLFIYCFAKYIFEY